MSKLRQLSPGLVSIYCPGCENEHNISTVEWQFNGDFDKPTFSPSLLITSGCYIADHEPGDHCWCTYNAAHPDNPASFVCGRCHSFITNGLIQFLTDSTHSLAGQTMELPENLSV